MKTSSRISAFRHLVTKPNNQNQVNVSSEPKRHFDMFYHGLKYYIAITRSFKSIFVSISINKSFTMLIFDDSIMDGDTPPPPPHWQKSQMPLIACIDDEKLDVKLPSALPSL